MPKLDAAKSRSVRALACTAFLVAIAGTAPGLLADDLAGRVLVVVDPVESRIEAGIGRLLIRDRDKVEGSIREVKVAESTERTLTLEVAYVGFENAEFRAEVLDPQKRTMRAIRSKPFVVPAGAATAERKATIPFELAGETGDESELRSSRVKLITSKAGSAVAQFVEMYALDKQWSPVVSPENVAVRVRPEPIGGTAGWIQRLTAPTPPPPRPRPTPPRGRNAVSEPQLRHVALSATAPAVVIQPESRVTTPVAVRRATSMQPSTRKIAAAEAVVSRNQAVISKLPRAVGRIAIADYKFAEVKQPATPQSTEPTNQVSASYVDLMGELTSDHPDLEPAEILGVFSRVYADANAKSGVFYYIPRGYRISYDPDLGGPKGLGFRISYDRRREGSERATVRMAASFDSAVDLREIRLAEKLLKAIDQRDSSFTFKPPLRPFPLAAPPDIDFTGALRGFVDGDQIAVVALSDSLEGIDLSWSTDPVDAQNIRRDLRDGIPISGVAAFDAPNSDAPTLVVPARVELTDPAIYKALAWSRTAPMRNTSPLPVILKGLHALVIEGNKPRVYSWDLGGAVLPSQAQVELDLSNVPSQVDSTAERVWVQYTLDRSCETCLDQVVDRILSADVWPREGAIVIRTLTPLEMTSAAEIWADVRSRFLDPNDRVAADAPRLHMNQDRTEYRIEPIFLAERTPPGGGDPWPLFEYRLIAVMPDGTIHEGANWIRSDSETVVIGTVQIQQSLGFVPGQE